MRVDGSSKPSPASCWSRSRSSTAPSESTPASISGASVSTLPPVVLLSVSRMKSRLTVLDGAADLAATAPEPAFLAGPKLLSAAGISFMIPRNLPHFTRIIVCTIGPPGAMAAVKALTPSAMVMRPMPLACMRALIEPSAAMPTSAHGPHCTDEAARPADRRMVLVASKQQLAAL
eukprot:scaffold36275_cov154-Isochrysis_galbana.AAC.27